MEIIDEQTGEPLPSADDRNTAMFAHLAAFASMVFPFGNVIGPLIVWMVRRDRSAFIDRHGRESLNFQLTFTLIFMVMMALAAGYAISSGLSDNEIGVFSSLIGFGFLFMVYSIAALVFIIIGAVKASNGEEYRYPLSIRFVR